MNGSAAAVGRPAPAGWPVGGGGVGGVSGGLVCGLLPRRVYFYNRL